MLTSFVKDIELAIIDLKDCINIKGMNLKSAFVEIIQLHDNTLQLILKKIELFLCSQVIDDIFPGFGIILDEFMSFQSQLHWCGASRL